MGGSVVRGERLRLHNNSESEEGQQTITCSPKIRMRLPDTLKHAILDRLLPLQPEKIILFGSYAYGEPHKDSDIDLLVVTNDDFLPQNYREKTDVYLEFADAIHELRKQIAIDLIVHTKPMHRKFIELGSMFSKEILQHGVVLYETDYPRVVESRRR